MSSKGFGYQEPHISAGEAARLERICDAVLSGDHDAGRSLAAWTDRITRKLGGEKAWKTWFVHHANDELGYPLASKFHETLQQCLPEEARAELQQKSKGCLTAMLQSDGLFLGRDFSLSSDGGFILSDRAVESLKREMPPESWADFEAQELIKSVALNPWQCVEQRLGVPFRESLMSRLSKLVEQGRAASVIGGWLVTVSCGVSSQVIGSDEDLTLFGWMMAHLREHHGTVYEQVLTAIRSEQILDSDELLIMDINCLCDVERAAGSSEENGEIKGDSVNRACLERLALVWRGDEMSLPELIGLLDKFTKDKAA